MFRVKLAPLPEEAVYGTRRRDRLKLAEHLARVLEGHREATSAVPEPVTLAKGMRSTRRGGCGRCRG